MVSSPVDFDVSLTKSCMTLVKMFIYNGWVLFCFGVAISLMLPIQIPKKAVLIFYYLRFD